MDDLAERVAAVATEGRRTLVAISGPPGAGKSTLAAALVPTLARTGIVATVVGMDGFHLDNTVLRHRSLEARKGAPETFDVAGLDAAMDRLGRDADVVLPCFDRSRDLAVAGAVVVGPEHRVVLVEGNYLHLDAPLWGSLARHWHYSVRLAPPLAVLRERLVRRWIDHGLNDNDARARAEGNDLPNAARVLNEALPVDLVIADG